MPRGIGRPTPVVPSPLHDSQVQRDRKTVLVPSGKTIAGAERKDVGPGTRIVDLTFAATTTPYATTGSLATTLAERQKTLDCYCSFCYKSVAVGWQLVRRFYLDTALGLETFNISSISAWLEETDVAATSDVQWQVRVHLWDTGGAATSDTDLTVVGGGYGGVLATDVDVDTAVYDRMDIQIQAANGSVKPPKCVNISVAIKEVVYA